MTIKQKALELVNRNAAKGGECKTLNQAGAPILRIRLVEAIAAHEADKSRHAAEMREQAERFSERDERLGEALYGLSARLLLDGWLEDNANHEAYEKVVAAFGKPLILAPVDPLAECLDAMLRRRTFDPAPEVVADEAAWLRAALDARGLAIVKKEAVNG